MLALFSISASVQGRGSLAGCRLWGRTESDTTEATQQQQQQQLRKKRAVVKFSNVFTKAKPHCISLLGLP